jgi:hypothetical protein
MPERRRLGPVGLLLTAALLSACGSTVQVSSTGQLPGGALGTGTGGDGLGGPAVPGSPQLSGTTGGTGALPAGSSTGAVTGPGGTSGTTGAGFPGAPGTPGASGPGVTATKVYVGIIQDKSAGALNSAAGVGSITSGDDDANTRAVIKDINAHGGVGGRQLVPVYASFDQTSTTPYDQQLSAICQQFTRDNPRVFAVVDAGLATATGYRECLTRAGVSIVSSSLPISNAAAFAALPAYLELGSPNIDRLASYLVTSLAQQHYFTPWNTTTGKAAPTGTVKVGVLTYDDRSYAEAVDRVLVPGLKRLGYDPVVERISQLNGAADTGAQAAAVKSAQLAFASNRVTHVIPFETNGNLSTFFLPTARSQAYYPRYGGDTGSAFEALLESGVVEQRQMNGAVGFGWIPSLDLRREDNPVDGRYSNKGTRDCMKLMKDNGITFDSGNAEGIAQNTCSVFYFIKAVLDRTPSQITQATFIRTAEALGTSFVKAGGLGLYLRPGRHDPSNKAYFWKHFDDCGCFRYDGPLRTIP